MDKAEIRLKTSALNRSIPVKIDNLINTVRWLGNGAR